MRTPPAEDDVRPGASTASLYRLLGDPRPEQGPAAHWICVHDPDNLWLWRPTWRLSSLSATPDSSAPHTRVPVMQAEGSPAEEEERVHLPDQPASLLSILSSQLVNLWMAPGMAPHGSTHPYRSSAPREASEAEQQGANIRDGLALLARQRDIEATAAAPVILAFRLPEYIRSMLQALPRVAGLRALPLAQPLPPPQLGEVGLVLHGEQWRAYPLSALGDEALLLWQQLGAALTEAASPGEWWAHTDVLALCASEDHYAQEHAILEHTLATTPTTRDTRDASIRAKRRYLREQLNALEKARICAVALHTARQQAYDHPQRWRDQLTTIHSLAQQLADRYAQVSRQESERSVSTTISLFFPEVDVFDALSAEHELAIGLDSPLDTTSAPPTPGPIQGGSQGVTADTLQHPRQRIEGLDPQESLRADPRQPVLDVSPQPDDAQVRPARHPVVGAADTTLQGTSAFEMDHQEQTSGDLVTVSETMLGEALSAVAATRIAQTQSPTPSQAPTAEQFTSRTSEAVPDPLIPAPEQAHGEAPLKRSTQTAPGPLGSVLEASLEASVTQAPLWEAIDLQQGLAALNHLTETTHLNVIAVPGFQEDRAVREASLARKSSWTSERGELRFLASNNLAVYFLDPRHPVPIQEAQARLAQLRESTVVTARIALGLWNLRRAEHTLTQNGFAPIRVVDFLEWRGVLKHTKASYPGAPTEETDGYRPEQKAAIRRDLLLLRHYFLRGTHVIQTRTQRRAIEVNGPYLNVTTVTDRTGVPTGGDLNEEDFTAVLIAPGGWIEAYGSYDDALFAEVNRRIFQLNPQNEQYALLIALYLVERWREQTHEGIPYETPLTMAQLLQASVISVDRHNLTNRFAPAIENALQLLKNEGVLGEATCLSTIDYHKSWGRAWLAARWRITPPEELIRRYIAKLEHATGMTFLAPAPGEATETSEGKSAESTATPSRGRTPPSSRVGQEETARKPQR